MTLPALTIRQPWADHLFRLPNRKDVENRTWPTNYRGELVIHAGREVDPAGVEALGPITAEQDRDRGHVLGVVLLVDVHRDGSSACTVWECAGNPWAFHDAEFGPRVYHWILDRPARLVTPIPARGRVGLWDAGPSITHLLRIGEVTE